MKDVDQAIKSNLTTTNEMGVEAGDFSANQNVEYRDIPIKPLPGGAYLVGREKGFVVGARGPELLRLDTDSHFITIAKTGGGKGTSVAIPNLLVHPGSTLSIEIGGATLNATIDCRRYLMKQEVHVFDPHGQTNEKCLSINFLDALNPELSTFESDIKMLVDTIMQMPDGKQEDNPYFRTLPADLIKSLIIYLKTVDEDEIPLKDRHLPKVAELLGQYGSESFNDLMTRFATDTGRHRRILNRVGNYLSGNGRNENKDSVVSSASNWMGFAEDVTLSSYLKKSDFSLADLRRKKMTIYMVMKDASLYEACHPFLRLMLDQAIYLVPNKGDAGHGFDVSDRILIMADEFTQLGKLKSIQQGMLTTRQKGITLWAIFQDIGGLRAIYGKETANSFLGNAACIQTFAVNDEETAEFISKRLGKQIAYIPSESVSYSVSEAETESDSKSKAKGTSKSKQETFSRGTTEGSNRTYSTNYMHSTTSALFGFYYDRDKTWTSADSYTNAYGTNWSRQRTVAESMGTGKSNQETLTSGTTKGITKNRTLTLQYNVQLIPRFDVTDVYEKLNTGSNQILFIATNGMYLSILEEQAKYYQVPLLIARSEGPRAPTFPEPLRPLKTPKAIALQKVKPSLQLCLPANLNNSIHFKLLPNVDVNRASVVTTRAGKELSIHDLFASYHMAAAEAETNPKNKKTRQKEKALREQIVLATKIIVQNSFKDVMKTNAIIDQENKQNSETARIMRSRLALVKKAAEQVTQKADQLKSMQRSVASVQETLNTYAHVLMHDAKIDGVFYAEIPGFKRYTEFYNYLRNVWSNELEIPRAPSAKELHRYMPKLSDKRFDELMLAVETSRKTGGQKIYAPQDLQEKPKSYSPIAKLPMPEHHLTKWATWARPYDKGNTYSLEEVEKVISHLEDKIGSSFVAKRLVSSQERKKHKETKRDLNFFVQAQERLLRKIHKEVQQDLMARQQMVGTRNQSIYEQTSAWGSFSDDLVRRAQDIQARNAKNEQAAHSINKDIDLVSCKRAVLSAANDILIAERIRKVGEVSSWSIWGVLDEQTRLLEGKKPVPEKSMLLDSPRKEDLTKELRLGIPPYQYSKI